MIRTKGEPGTGDIVQAVRHMRKMNSEIAKLTSMREDELFEAAKNLQVPFELVKFVHDNGKLPVVNFAAGGVATPADAALMMQLGAEGVFVGSGIFKSGVLRQNVLDEIGDGGLAVGSGDADETHLPLRMTEPCGAELSVERTGVLCQDLPVAQPQISVTTVTVICIPGLDKATNLLAITIITIVIVIG